MLQIMDQGGSWIKRILNSLFFSSKVFVRICEYFVRKFKVFKIIFYLYPQMSKLSWLEFLWALVTSCCAIYNWTCVSKTDNCNCSSSSLPYSWCTWMNECTVFLSWSWVWMGLSWSLLYSTIPYLCDAQVCVIYCTSGILTHVCDT